MINRLNKMLGKHAELKEGITTFAEFVPKKDLKKITRFDKTILSDDLVEPAITHVLFIKEEIYFDILINFSKNVLFVLVEGIYIPMDLTRDEFNSALMGVCGRPPNHFYKKEVNGIYYLHCWWDKVW